MSRLDNRIIIGAIFTIAILSTVVILDPWNTLYPGGWEIGTQFDSARVNGVGANPASVSADFIDGSYLNSRGGYLKLDDGAPRVPAADASSLEKALYGQLQPVYEEYPEYFGSSKLAFDIDYPYTVTRAAYGDEWYKSPDDEPYRVYDEWDPAKQSYSFFAHYVYIFTVDIKTDAYAELVGSYVYGTTEGLPSNYPSDHEVTARVFSQVGLQPWNVVNGQILTYNDTEAELSNIFYGIMSASVASVEVGNMVDETEIGAGESLDNWDYDTYMKGLVQPHKDHSGAALAMYYDDGSSSYGGYPSVADNADVEDTVINIVETGTTIPKSVIIETAADLESGLIVNYGFPGTWSDWTPVNKYVRYEVRVDAVYSAELTIRTGDQDPPGDKTEDQEIDDVQTMTEIIAEEIDKAFTVLEERIPNFFNSILLPIAVIGGVVIIVLVLFYIVLGKVRG